MSRNIEEVYATGGIEKGSMFLCTWIGEEIWLKVKSPISASAGVTRVIIRLGGFDLRG